MADFVLGRLKFVWKNNWTTGTAYIKDDVVKHGGSVYVCILNHTAPASFTTNQATYWQKMLTGQNFAGNFTGSTLYKVDDVVLYGSSLWICTTQHTSSTTLNESNFSLFLPGLEFEDSWSSSTAYQKGDIVTVGGYQYVCVLQNSNQNPYNNATYWDILTTGFSLKGTFNPATVYNQGDVVQYGGNVYVFDVKTTAGQLPTNTAYADLLVEGIKLQTAVWAIGTSYKIGEVVIHLNSSYRAVRDNVGITPGTSNADWLLYNQGDPAGVMTTRGDLITRGTLGAVRLPLGRSGTVLTSNGTDAIWAEANNPTNIYYVSTSGNDTTGDGSEHLPYRTIKKASTQTNKSGILSFNTISGGTGGTPNTYKNVASTGGSGSGATFEVVTDGSSTASVTVVNQGSNFAVGNTITIDGSLLGGSSNVTFVVTAVSAGDLIRVKNGTYFETFPIRLSAGTTIEGDSLRTTVVRPNSGSSSQIATVGSIGANSASRVPGTYLNCISTTNGSGVGAKFTVVVDGSSAITVTCTHGGVDYAVGNTITIADSQLGSGGAAALTATVATLKDNNVAEMFLVNDAVNVRQFSFTGMTTGARVFSLDPTGTISSASPYIQNCTSVNTGTTGMYIDGLSQVSGNKSMLANDFTQINSDGIGVHVLRGGRAELVSVFAYYCDKAFFAESGGFLRALNCSMAYGEQGAVATGTLASETPLVVQARGVQLYFTGNITNVSGGAAYVPVAGDTIRGNTSNATGTIRNYQANPKILYLTNVTGTFDQAETVIGTKANSSTFTFVVGSIEGSAGTAQIGQKGSLFLLKSTGGQLSTAAAIKVGANIAFAGDATVYAVTAVTDEDTANQFATVRINPEKTTSVAENADISITEYYSNIRMTGHDFLNIGTGDFVTTNYPGTPTQNPDQADEVVTSGGGRVYWTSTDQRGDFRVGTLFRIEQATGVATLNADAFDLSGLTQLQLGSIGAQIGATINEFSTDGTLSGNSDIAVPTEQAVKTYVDTNSFSTGKAIAMSIVFG